MDRYDDLRRIGGGSFGSVYRARRVGPAGDDGVPAEVAIKVLHKRVYATEHERTMREVNLLARLKHPNITRYIESFEHGGFLHIVFTLEAGGSLRDVIERMGRLPVPAVARVFCEMVEALRYLHEGRDGHDAVIHRDLKPENVLLSSDGHVRLADFGLSRELGDGSASLSAVGTEKYMAPEIARGFACPGGASVSYTATADVWSLGALLWDLLTGSPDAVLGKAALNPAEGYAVDVRWEPPALPPDIDPSLGAVARRLLVADPSCRPTIADVLGFPELGYVRTAAEHVTPAMLPSPPPPPAPAGDSGRVRLLPTDGDTMTTMPSAATASALVEVAFACNACGRCVVPRGATTRVTVRNTPSGSRGGDPRSIAEGESDVQDSVWASCVAPEVVRAPERSLHKPLTAKYLELFFSRDLRCCCGVPLGFVLEDDAGAVHSPPGEHGRSHKLVYYNGSRGWVLRLADPAACAAWDRVRGTLLGRSVDAKAPPVPRHFELALDLAGLLRIRGPSRRTEDILVTVVSSLRAIRDSGGVYFRSLAPDETPTSNGGLWARDDAPAASDGSLRIDVTSSATAALLAALPLGRVVVVSRDLAEKLGAHAHEAVSEMAGGGGGSGAPAEEEKGAPVPQPPPSPPPLAHDAFYKVCIPRGALELLNTGVTALYCDRGGGSSSASAASALDGAPCHLLPFPTTLAEFLDLTEAVPPSTGGEPQLHGALRLPPSATLLASAAGADAAARHVAAGSGPRPPPAADTAVPCFVLLRMLLRDADTRLEPDAVLAAGRLQLRGAVRAFEAACSARGRHPAGVVAYYEADCAFRQERVLTRRFPERGLLAGVPFALLRCCCCCQGGCGCRGSPGGGAAQLQADLDELCALQEEQLPGEGGGAGLPARS